MKCTRTWVPAALVGLCLSVLPPLGAAEVIRIPVGSQNPGAANIDRPALGLLKARVVSDYGEPEKRYAPVGTPPIERWDYEQFSVYFEYDHVVHSVLKGPNAPH